MKTEWEIKLLTPGAPDSERVLAVATNSGMNIEGVRAGKQRDIYLDSASYDLARAGVALRVREREGERES